MLLLIVSFNDNVQCEKKIMQTLTLHIPDDKFPLLLEELNKFNEIKIEFNSKILTKEDIIKNIKQAVTELNLIKKGKKKARPARELLNEL